MIVLALAERAPDRLREAVGRSHWMLEMRGGVLHTARGRRNLLRGQSSHQHEATSSDASGRGILVNSDEA